MLKIIKKKFGLILGLLVVTTILLCTPVFTLVGTLTPLTFRALDNDATFHYTAPVQTTQAFTQTTTSYDLNNFTKRSNDNVIITDVSTENNNQYNGNTTYQAITLDNSAFKDHTNPMMLLRKKTGLAATGALVTSDITFKANSYYEIAVDYYMLGDDAEQSAFYLGDYRITLQPQKNWRTSIIYLHTDRLADVTMTAKLYLGDESKPVDAAIYYDNFRVTAVNQTKFNQSVAALEKGQIDRCYFDLTNKTDVKDADNQDLFANDQFTQPTATAGNVIVRKEVATDAVPTLLNFTDRNYFHTQSGAGSVMLLAAQENNAAIKLTNYDFKPQPHEVYMFQFYSLMPDDTEKFYFTIGDYYQEIVATACDYHNGWQLNTVFYVAGYDLNQSATLGFALAQAGNTTTGWVALDDLRVYRVSGAYADNNRTTDGVHNYYDANTDQSSPDFDNGYFDLGIASNLSSTYPYPLKVSGDWTATNGAMNGIVNTYFWPYREENVTNPGVIGQNNLNNNIYMLRKTDGDNAQPNVVTSPSFSTTAGSSTYISFDACAYNNAPVIARVVLDEDDTTREIARMTLQANAWQHYEFEIKESDLGSNRNCRLTFTMHNNGYAFIDNVRTSSENAYEFATPATTKSTTIDLANSAMLASLWQNTDDNLNYLGVAADGDGQGITLENKNQVTVTAKHLLSYTLTTGSYYKVTATAYGQNAQLKLSGFDGYLAVTSDSEKNLHDYTLYILATDDTTTLNFLINLGLAEDADADAEQCDGQIYLTNLTISSINEQDYDLAGKLNDARIKVLTASNADDTTDTDDIIDDDSGNNNFWGENWWYMVPTLITALAIVLALVAYFMRKIKFDKHITNKTTTYARDVKIKNNRKKIVAEKSTKVDNVTDATPRN